MSEEQIIRLAIHYGGSMKKVQDDYSYIHELGCTSVFWKLSEIEWRKFEDYIVSENVKAPISIIWFKEAKEDMKMVKYVFDSANFDMLVLHSSAKSTGEIDVFIEHDCSKYLIGYEADEKERMGEDGYEPDADERMAEEGDDESDDDDEPPKENDTAGDSAKESDTQFKKEVDKDRNQNKGKGHTEVDDGDDVLIDAGNGVDDDRFMTVFEEGTRTTVEFDEATHRLVEACRTKEEEEEETDTEIGLDDKIYPDTPLESDEEWEQWNNPQREKGKQKYHGDLNKEPYIWLFQTFNSGLDFKDQLLRYSLNTQYDIKMARSEANRIAAICCNKKCSWKVYCSVEPRLNKWMVKVCHCSHNHAKSSRVSMLKQGVIGGLFREEIRRNVNLTAAEIKDIIKERYNIVVNISKCYKGRRIALDSVLEAQSIQFGKLWDYEAELKRFNKDVTTEILTVDNNGQQQFNGFYICFKEFRDTWKKYCRPVIGLDGCFLKWDLEGDLLAACGRDADNKMYPIAWAVVTGENKDTWGWFLQKLKLDLDIGVGSNVTIISDKQKGLVIAVATELPQAEHRMCARHIYCNWKKSFNRSEYKNLFWGVAYSYHEGEYEEKMKLVHAYDPAAYEALLVTDPRKWCRAFFNPESHCADVHNNLSEAFNRTIKMARTKPVITMLEDIRRQAMTRTSRRWLKASLIDSHLTPNTYAILEKARIAKKYCQTLRSSKYLYEVMEFNIGYTVDLAKHQCACRRWDLTGIPCKHAVCILDDNQDDLEKYVADYYQTSYLKNTYVDNIKPVNGEPLWKKTWKLPIGIPNIRKPRGRPKNRDRKKEPFESLQNAGKSTRHGRISHCSQCGQAGHIKSGCKNEHVVVEGPKNRRGRPRKLSTVEVQPLRQSKPRQPGANATISSQPFQSGQSSYEVPATSSALEPLVFSNKPQGKKRGRPLKTRKVENIPRGNGIFWSPFTGRPFQVFGDKAYDMSQRE